MVFQRYFDQWGHLFNTCMRSWGQHLHPLFSSKLSSLALQVLLWVPDAETQPCISLLFNTNSLFGTFRIPGTFCWPTVVPSAVDSSRCHPVLIYTLLVPTELKERPSPQRSSWPPCFNAVKVTILTPLHHSVLHIPHK